MEKREVVLFRGYGKFLLNGLKLDPDTIGVIQVTEGQNVTVSLSNMTPGTEIIIRQL